MGAKKETAATATDISRIVGYQSGDQSRSIHSDTWGTINLEIKYTVIIIKRNPWSFITNNERNKQSKYNSLSF